MKTHLPVQQFVGPDDKIQPPVTQSGHDFPGLTGILKTGEHGDLHGIVREGWQGISPETQITALPQLVTAEGKKYWVIKTAGQSVVYGFYGGEPVGKGESRKVLKALDK